MRTKSKDFYKVFAATLAGIDVRRVTKKMRHAAKLAAFGMQYGIKARRFPLTQVDISIIEARVMAEERRKQDDRERTDRGA